MPFPSGLCLTSVAWRVMYSMPKSEGPAGGGGIYLVPHRKSNILQEMQTGRICVLQLKVTTLPLNLLCIKHRNIWAHQDLVLSHHHPELTTWGKCRKARKKQKKKTGWKTGPSSRMAGHNSPIIAAGHNEICTQGAYWSLGRAILLLTAYTASNSCHSQGIADIQLCMQYYKKSLDDKVQ